MIAGEYIVEQHPEHFAWNGEGIKWKGMCLNRFHTIQFEHVNNKVWQRSSSDKAYIFPS